MTIGYEITKPELYRDFGKLRNAIVHFAAPNVDYSERVLRFAFEVVQPAIKVVTDEHEARRFL
jgi:hypothetical protein